MKYWIIILLAVWTTYGSAQNISIDRITLPWDLTHEPIALVEKGSIPLVAENDLEIVISHLTQLGCDLQIFLTTNPIIPDLYEASQQIIASGVVQSGTVSLKAGDEVLLEDGFEVQTGGILEISMGPCTF